MAKSPESQQENYFEIGGKRVEKKDAWKSTIEEMKNAAQAEFDELFSINKYLFEKVCASKELNVAEVLFIKTKIGENLDQLTLVFDQFMSSLDNFKEKVSRRPDWERLENSINDFDKTLRKQTANIKNFEQRLGVKATEREEKDRKKQANPELTDKEKEIIRQCQEEIEKSTNEIQAAKKLSKIAEKNLNFERKFKVDQRIKRNEADIEKQQLTKDKILGKEQDSIAIDPKKIFLLRLMQKESHRTWKRDKKLEQIGEVGDNFSGYLRQNIKKGEIIEVFDGKDFDAPIYKTLHVSKILKTDSNYYVISTNGIWYKLFLQEEPAGQEKGEPDNQGETSRSGAADQSNASPENQESKTAEETAGKTDNKTAEAAGKESEPETNKGKDSTDQNEENGKSDKEETVKNTVNEATSGETNAEQSAGSRPTEPKDDTGEAKSEEPKAAGESKTDESSSKGMPQEDAGKTANEQQDEINKKAEAADSLEKIYEQAYNAELKLGNLYEELNEAKRQGQADKIQALEQDIKTNEDALYEFYKAIHGEAEAKIKFDNRIRELKEVKFEDDRTAEEGGFYQAASTNEETKSTGQTGESREGGTETRTGAEGDGKKEKQELLDKKKLIEINLKSVYKALFKLLKKGEKENSKSVSSRRKMLAKYKDQLIEVMNNLRQIGGEENQESAGEIIRRIIKEARNDAGYYEARTADEDETADGKKSEQDAGATGNEGKTDQEESPTIPILSDEEIDALLKGLNPEGGEPDEARPDQAGTHPPEEPFTPRDDESGKQKPKSEFEAKKEAIANEIKRLFLEFYSIDKNDSAKLEERIAKQREIVRQRILLFELFKVNKFPDIAILSVEMMDEINQEIDNFIEIIEKEVKRELNISDAPPADDDNKKNEPEAMPEQEFEAGKDRMKNELRSAYRQYLSLDEEAIESARDTWDKILTIVQNLGALFKKRFPEMSLDDCAKSAHKIHKEISEEIDKEFSQNFEKNQGNAKKDHKTESREKNSAAELSSAEKLFKDKHNISKEALESINGFNELSEGQKLLVLENFRQLTLSTIHDEAKTDYKKSLKSYEAKKKGFWSRKGDWSDTKEHLKIMLPNLKNSVLKPYYLRKFEKNTALNIAKRGLSDQDKEILQQQVNVIKEFKPEAEVVNGRLNIKYINMTNASREEQELANAFNKSANDFRSLPLAWSYLSADKKQQNNYNKIKNQYEEAKGNIFNEKARKGDDGEDTFLRMNEVDKQIQLNQFLNAHPEVEKQLANIKDQRVWWRALVNMGTERGLYGGAGFVGRTLSMSLIGIIGMPATAAAIGGVMAYRRSKENLKEQANNSRKGDKIIATEFLTKKGKTRYHKKSDFINIITLNRRIEELLKTYQARIDEDTAVLSDEEMEKRLNHLAADQKNLKRLLAYAQTKVEQGLINFGQQEHRLSNQYNFVQNLGKAEVYSRDIFYSRELDDRLKKVLFGRKEKISKAERDYVIKQTINGAAISAGFAVGGWLLSHAIFNIYDNWKAFSSNKASQAQIKESTIKADVKQPLNKKLHELRILTDEHRSQQSGQSGQGTPDQGNRVLQRETAGTEKAVSADLKNAVNKPEIAAGEPGLKSNFTLELGKGKVPGQLERVFHMMSVDSMKNALGSNQTFGEAEAAKSLNVAANLTRLAEGKNVLGLKAVEVKNVFEWHEKTHTLNIKNYQGFNSLVKELNKNADVLWRKGSLSSKGAAADYVGDIKKGTWVRIIKAEGLEDKIQGHKDIKPEQIGDFRKAVPESPRAGGGKIITGARHHGFTSAAESDIPSAEQMKSVREHLMDNDHWNKTISTDPGGKRTGLIWDKEVHGLNVSDKYLNERIWLRVFDDSNNGRASRIYLMQDNRMIESFNEWQIKDRFGDQGLEAVSLKVESYAQKLIDSRLHEFEELAGKNISLNQAEEFGIKIFGKNSLPPEDLAKIDFLKTAGELSHNEIVNRFKVYDELAGEKISLKQIDHYFDAIKRLGARSGLRADFIRVWSDYHNVIAFNKILDACDIDLKKLDMFRDISPGVDQNGNLIINYISNGARIPYLGSSGNFRTIIHPDGKVFMHGPGIWQKSYDKISDLKEILSEPIKAANELKQAETVKNSAGI